MSMGLFLKQDEQRSQLQSKIAADLQDRLKTPAMETSNRKPQPAFLDNQRQTSSLAWLWILLGVGVVLGVLIVVVLL